MGGAKTQNLIMKSLTNETREVQKPDDQTGILKITRTAKSDVGPPSLVDWDIDGYSSSFGGQLLNTPDVSVSTTNRQRGSQYFLDIEFEIETSTAAAGSDFIFEYEVDDGNAVETSQFFYQNGISASAQATGGESDYEFRASAELERISGTYVDNQKAEDPTDFSEVSRLGSSNFVFISESSPFTKHGGEPIPYFRGPGSLEAPSQSFSSRDSTCILVLHWNQDHAQNFPVVRVKQGGNVYLEVRNAQSDIELHSDFAEDRLYCSSTHVGNILIAECRIDSSKNRARGSVNREISESPSSLSSPSFSSGSTQIEIDPKSNNIHAKLFDALLYSEDVGHNIDKLSKQLSYFYKADTTSPSVDSVGEGSPHVQNHLFFDSKIQDYDMHVASNPVKRFDQSGTEVWSFNGDGLSVATDSRFSPAVGTSTNANVHRISPNGNPIWTFDGHSAAVEAVETGIETHTYSASLDGTVKKIDSEGTPVWNFGDHNGAVRDIALFSDVAVYSGGADNTVRRIVESTGNQDWKFDGHFDTITAVETGSQERIYTSAANGEIRALDNDGNEIYLASPASAGSPTIDDLAVNESSLYAITTSKIFKLDKLDGSVVWDRIAYKSNPSKSSPSLSAIAARPEGGIAASENSENLIILFDKDGNVENSLSTPGTTHDISIQPGSYEPHHNI